MDELIKIANAKLTTFLNDVNVGKWEEVYLLVEQLKKSESLANSKIKKEIEKIYNGDVSDIKELRKKVKDVESKINYMTIHQSKEMNAITNSLGRFNKDTCTIDMYSNGTVVLNKLKYEIIGFNDVLRKVGEKKKEYLLKDQINISTSKLLIYAVKKLNINSNISQFTFSEYAEIRGIDKNQVNRNKLKDDIEIFKRLGNIKYESTNKKDNDLILNTLVYKALYKDGNVTIEFNPEFVEGLKNTYMYFPKSLMKLNGKEFTNSFLLGWYIFSQFRIEWTTTLTRSVKSCLSQLSLPKKENVSRRYQQLIIEPFEKILDILCNNVPELYIEFDRDYKNITEFLDSSIIIELKESKISQLYIEQQKKKLSKNIKHNIDKKETNIILCKQYIKEGKTNKEISKLLNISIRTIRNYKAEIEKRKNGN